MKKMVIIGGSNGIGAAFANKFHHDKDITIIDIKKPSLFAFDYKFIQFDLNLDNVELIKKDIEDADSLIISAGIGDVRKFEYYSPAEIEKYFNVNVVSISKILWFYFPRLLSDKECECLVMSSIAGDLSSPLFSIYSATKAGLSKMCEALNIELYKANSKNVITCVKPLSFKGSSFNGDETVLEILEPLLQFCIESMRSKRTSVYYEEKTCLDIISRYRKDPFAFGLSSYEYKVLNKRISKKKTIVGYLSGTFDLFHIGHLNLLEKAKRQCDYLIVGIHPSGSWKGKDTFIPFEERVSILRSIKYVDSVVTAPDEDCDAWSVYKYDKLFVGSDYKGTERFKRYEELLKNKATIIYFEYTKSTSSSQIRDLIKKGL